MNCKVCKPHTSISCLNPKWASSNLRVRSKTTALTWACKKWPVAGTARALAADIDLKAQGSFWFFNEVNVLHKAHSGIWGNKGVYCTKHIGFSSLLQGDTNPARATLRDRGGPGCLQPSGSAAEHVPALSWIWPSMSFRLNSLACMVLGFRNIAGVSLGCLLDPKEEVNRCVNVGSAS